MISLPISWEPYPGKKMNCRANRIVRQLVCSAVYTLLV